MNGEVQKAGTNRLGAPQGREELKDEVSDVLHS